MCIRNFGDVEAYRPWVKKMRPADRLVLHGNSGGAPLYPYWNGNMRASGIWIGRLRGGTRAEEINTRRNKDSAVVPPSPDFNGKGNQGEGILELERPF